jgi:pimeloyl-ACP methyl ester carboxylesterase
MCSVETLSIESIEVARDLYVRSGLREKLAKYHDDVDSAFWGWNDVWLSQEFRDWNIADALPHIEAPTLAIQGEDDEYGAAAQVETVARETQRGELLLIPGCKHSPHRDQPDIVIDAVKAFVDEYAS